MRVRLLLAVSLLALACSSSKQSVPDANVANDANDNTADVSVDHFAGLCPGGFPCCDFASPAGAAAGLCNPDQCIVIADAGTPAASACVACPDGYFCAVLCPSPNGGCGGAPTCCRAQ
jgi:hypothetical protein